MKLHPSLIGLLAALLCLPSIAPAFAQDPGSRLLEEVEFRDATVSDAIRVIAEQADVNIVATSDAGRRRFTLFLRQLTVSDAIDSIARVAGLWYRHNAKTGVYVVMTTDEYFKDIVVSREEATEIFTLRYQNVVKVARTLEAMFGSDRVELDLQDDFEDDLELPGATLSTSDSSGRSGTGTARRTGASSRSDARRSYGGRSGGGGEGITKDDIGELTTEQIALLEATERRPGEDPLVLSESTLARVRKNSQQPIFVSVNREHNQLFVRTADERAMAEIRHLVRESDRPTPQVLLEMKVLSIALGDGFESAFNLSYGSDSTGTGPADGQPPNPLQTGAASGPEQLLGLVNAGTIGASTFVFQIMNDNIRARLQVLQSEDRINILATPMLLASNNRPARIFIGEETVLTTGFTAQTVSAGGGDNTFIATPVPTTEVVEIGNTLTILPSINADRTVLMRLLQQSSRLQPGGGTIPLVAGGSVTTVSIDTVDKSTMEGTAMAKDGLTVVIGGMITETNSKGERKVPVLGDVPLLGGLFKQVDDSTEKQELVLLITPHVFTTPEEAEAISRQRFGELAQSPNGIDIYLDQLDAVRAQSAAGRATAEAVQRASPVPMSDRAGLEGAYVALVRFAAERMRQPRLVQPENARIENVRLAYNRPFFLVPDPALESLPRRSWREGALYVTAVEVRNRATVAKSLDERGFSGQWLAAAVQTPTIAAGAHTHVYLVSDRPFEQAAVPPPGG
ncbi:type II secretory pathway, component PulD [Thioflavicoccus mobilis 8321]|uniref:Type II secretory pathway, component PulD n=1 Tax=Thioflavicoccus mobilis 8321 TaxID=765912 RepID=L0GUK8_9GAMM|nr:DUF3438 family protein [Thioflavicoccus mobilis]AGA89492.1 type II secretory pathway, component PulD [Thioflavicoccus mobilis 8321]